MKNLEAVAVADPALLLREAHAPEALKELLILPWCDWSKDDCLRAQSLLAAFAKAAAAPPVAQDLLAARREALEAAAGICEERADRRFAENGTREPDTNACYYRGRAADEYQARDEEDESCAAAIRKLKDATNGR